jgi:hypothetical protein
VLSSPSEIFLNGQYLGDIDTEKLAIDERDNLTIKRCPHCKEFLKETPKKEAPGQ